MSIKIYSIEEFLKIDIERDKVVVKDGSIILQAKTKNNRWIEYDISLDRLNSHEKILSWVCHLSEKNWVKPPLLRQLILVALTEHNLLHEGFWDA